ncbi:hypothetical protein D3C87_1722250 [compost metagenome]
MMNSQMFTCTAPERIVTTLIGGRCAKPEVTSISRIVSKVIPALSSLNVSSLPQNSRIGAAIASKANEPIHQPAMPPRTENTVATSA